MSNIADHGRLSGLILIWAANQSYAFRHCERLKIDSVDIRATTDALSVAICLAETRCKRRKLRWLPT